MPNHFDGRSSSARFGWLRDRTWLIALTLVSTLLPAGPGAVASPDDRADPRAFALPEAAREVIGQRTARTKRFRLPGTGRFAEVATGRALHYRDAAGAWRPSRAELRSRDGGLVAEELPLRVEVRAAGLGLGTPDGASGVFFVSEVPPVVTGQTLLLRAPRGDLDWEWTLDPRELKLTSRPVARPRGERVYAFPYTPWGTLPPLAVDRDGQLRVGSWVIGRPFVEGAGGEVYEVARWELDPASGALAIAVDDSLLPPRAYPYRIDPPLTEAAGVAESVTWAPFTGERVGWDDPQRALTNNNAKAKAVDLAPAPDPDRSTGLYVHDFGFDLHEQAKIAGIALALDRSVGGCGNCSVPNDCVRAEQLALSKDGAAVVGANRATRPAGQRAATRLSPSAGPRTCGIRRGPWRRSRVRPSARCSRRRGRRPRGAAIPMPRSTSSRSPSTGNSPTFRRGSSTRPTTPSSARPCRTRSRATSPTRGSTRPATTASWCASRAPRSPSSSTPSAAGSPPPCWSFSSSSTPRTGAAAARWTSIG